MIAYRRGAFQRDAGDLRPAEKLFREAHRLGIHDATVDLGTLLLARGEREEAEQLYARAAAENHAGALNELGILRKNQGRLDEAHLAGDRREAVGRWRFVARAGHAGARANLREFYPETHI